MSFAGAKFSVQCLDALSIGRKIIVPAGIGAPQLLSGVKNVASVRLCRYNSWSPVPLAPLGFLEQWVKESFFGGGGSNEECKGVVVFCLKFEHAYACDALEDFDVKASV